MDTTRFRDTKQYSRPRRDKNMFVSTVRKSTSGPRKHPICNDYNDHAKIDNKDICYELKEISEKHFEQLKGRPQLLHGNNSGNSYTVRDAFSNVK